MRLLDSEPDETLLRPAKRNWAPIPRLALIAWLVFFSLFLYQLGRGRGILLLMDGIFIPIHEGGHLLFGYLGLTPGIAGGTILQLLVPFALAVYFFTEREAQGIAFCMFFFFEQFLPIATYMADARAQKLRLLTIGDSEYVIHDWNYLFTKMGVLKHDIEIANTVRFIAWMGMVGVVLWLIWRGLNDVPKREKE